MRVVAILIFSLALMIGTAAIGSHFSIQTSSAPSTEITEQSDFWTVLSHGFDWAWQMSTFTVPGMPAGISYFWSFLGLVVIICVVLVILGIS